MKIKRLRHEFVEFVPDELEEGVLYVSMQFATAVHRCCCGCGNQVVTPISPADWTLKYDGIGISLYPSIGNWSFPCQSHYWIREGRVEWAARWTKDMIDAGRQRDTRLRTHYFDGAAEEAKGAPKMPQRQPLWQMIWRRFRK